MVFLFFFPENVSKGIPQPIYQKENRVFSKKKKQDQWKARRTNQEKARKKGSRNKGGRRRQQPSTSSNVESTHHRTALQMGSQRNQLRSTKPRQQPTFFSLSCNIIPKGPSRNRCLPWLDDERQLQLLHHRVLERSPISFLPNIPPKACNHSIKFPSRRTTTSIEDLDLFTWANKLLFPVRILNLNSQDGA